MFCFPFHELGSLACSDSLDGGSVCCKSSTCTGQHITEKTPTYIDASSGIRNYDLSVRCSDSPRHTP